MEDPNEKIIEKKLPTHIGQNRAQRRAKKSPNRFKGMHPAIVAAISPVNSKKKRQANTHEVSPFEQWQRKRVLAKGGK